MRDEEDKVDGAWFRWWPDHVALLKQSIVGTFNYKGRSRRTEVAMLWVATALTMSVASGFTRPLGFPGDLLAQLVIALGLLLPCFALLVRRLHDQDRSGWWASLLLPFTALSIYQRLEFTLLTPPPELAHRLPALPGWIIVIGLPIWLLLMTFILAPGTDGPNRFGPDPRSSIHSEQLGARDQQDEAEGAQDPLLG